MRKLCYALVALCINAVSAYAQPTILDPNLTVSLVADTLDIPSSMAFIGVDDILVLQKNDGKVRRVLNGALLANPVLDVDVDPRSFGGLLGIAIHPNFQTNKYVYLFYTEGSGGNDTLGSAVANRIYRYTWDSASGTLTAPLLIMSLPFSATSGNYSGVMAFGPDGKLYVTVGDQGLSGQLQNNSGGAAPNDTSVILRLNDDGTAPKNNPFYSQGGVVAKYFAYGIRNSFGMAFDPVSGKLWNTENGPANWDEINLVAPGFNSGWNKIQGPMSRDLEGENEADLFSLTRSRYSDPEFSWFESVGLTGMAFVDSLELGPEYENNLFIGDYVFGNLSRFELNKRRDGIDFTLLEDLRDKVADNANERNDVRHRHRFRKHLGRENRPGRTALRAFDQRWRDLCRSSGRGNWRIVGGRRRTRRAIQFGLESCRWHGAICGYTIERCAAGRPRHRQQCDYRDSDQNEKIFVLRASDGAEWGIDDQGLSIADLSGAGIRHE